ncbi:unnamed protein product [Rotaria sp. Silwood2]|nr:unnamed protein product [Rotaria sp. Silwood2]CAF4375715.1 unnamed protein product [Rotaria sp. Silwood2]
MDVNQEETLIGFYMSIICYCIVESSGIPKLDENTKWIQDGTTVAGGKRWGTDLGSLNFPSGICVDDDETVYIADYSNNRVVEWKKGATSGKVVAGDGDQRNRADRLRHPKDVIFDKTSDSLIIADEGNRRVVRCPRQSDANMETIVSNIDPSDLAMDSDGNLYVCDFEKHEVKRWKIGDTDGTVVAGGNGKGVRLHQLSHPTCIFVDKDHSVYVSDWGGHRIVKWAKDAKKGVLIAGGDGFSRDPMALADPFGVFVDDLDTLYVADWKKHRIVRWLKGDTQASIVVGEDKDGNAPNQFCHPMDIAFDKHGNLYVSDYSNHRVQKFSIHSDNVE